MKIKELLKISSDAFARLSTAQKMKIVKYMEQVANRRVLNLKAHGLDYVSPAVHLYGGKVHKTPMPRTPKNIRKSREPALVNRLTDSFSRAKNFLNMKTSKVAGASEYLRKAGQDFASEGALKSASKAQQRKFWTAYNQMRDLYPSLFQKGQDKYLKYREELYQIMVKKTKNGYRFKNIEESLKLMAEKLGVPTPYKGEVGFAPEPAPEPETPFDDKLKFEKIKSPFEFDE